MAKNDLGAWRGVDAERLRADREAAIGTDLHVGALAPNKGPPGTLGYGAQHGAFFFQGEVPGLLGFHFEFAVELVLIAMEAQGLNMGIGVVEIRNVLAGEIGGQTFLPEEMSALDFALGLGSRGVTESDAVEVKRLAQLSEGFGDMGEKEAVKVHVDFQGQSVFDKGAGEQIKVRQQVFLLIDFGGGKDAAAIIEHVDHGKGFWTVGKPTVGRGIQLPQLADVTPLPPPDGSGWAAIGFGVGAVVLDGPAPNLSPIDLVVVFAEDLAGSEAVRGCRLATEPLMQEGLDLRGPGGGMVAAREPRSPAGLLMMGAGFQIAAVEFVEATASQADSLSRGFDFELAGAEQSQHVTDERRGATMDQLPSTISFSSEQGNKPWGSLSPRPPGIFRFFAAPAEGNKQ